MAAPDAIGQPFARLLKRKRRTKIGMNLECLRAGRLCYGEDNRMLVLECVHLYRTHPPSPEVLVDPLLAELDGAVVNCTHAIFGCGRNGPRIYAPGIAANRPLTLEQCTLLISILRYALGWPELAASRTVVAQTL